MVLFVGHKQVHPTIIIKISPGTAARIAAALHGRAIGHFREDTRPIIVIQNIVSGQTDRDEKIQVTVIIKISPRAAFGIHVFGGYESALHSHKSFVVIIVVEEIARRAKIRNKQVHVSILIVVTPGHSSGIAAIGNDVGRSDLCERRIDIQQSRFADSTALSIGDLKLVLPGMNELHISYRECRVRGAGKRLLVEVPFINQRRRAHSARAQQNGCAHAYRLVLGLEAEHRRLLANCGRNPKKQNRYCVQQPPPYWREVRAALQPISGARVALGCGHEAR